MRINTGVEFAQNLCHFYVQYRTQKYNSNKEIDGLYSDFPGNDRYILSWSLIYMYARSIVVYLSMIKRIHYSFKVINTQKKEGC